MSDILIRDVDISFKESDGVFATCLILEAIQNPDKTIGIKVQNGSKELEAILIPEHGRLIDADVLKETIRCTDTDEVKFLSTRKLHITLNNWIDKHKTVIPASE